MWQSQDRIDLKKIKEPLQNNKKGLGICGLEHGYGPQSPRICFASIIKSIARINKTTFRSNHVSRPIEYRPWGRLAPDPEGFLEVHWAFCIFSSFFKPPKPWEILSVRSFRRSPAFRSADVTWRLNCGRWKAERKAGRTPVSDPLKHSVWVVSSSLTIRMVVMDFVLNRSALSR